MYTCKHTGCKPWLWEADFQKKALWENSPGKTVDSTFSWSSTMTSSVILRKLKSCIGLTDTFKVETQNLGQYYTVFPPNWASNRIALKHMITSTHCQYKSLLLSTTQLLIRPWQTLLLSYKKITAKLKSTTIIRGNVMTPSLFKGSYDCSIWLWLSWQLKKIVCNCLSSCSGKQEVGAEDLPGYTWRGQGGRGWRRPPLGSGWDASHDPVAYGTSPQVSYVHMIPNPSASKKSPFWEQDGIWVIKPGRHQCMKRPFLQHDLQ